MQADPRAAPPFDVTLTWVFGRYDPADNILYSGCPRPTFIVEASDMRALFDELFGLIRRCSNKPTLFVDFANVRFDPHLGAVYKETLMRLGSVVDAIYRYNVPRDVSGTLTSSFIRTSNVSVRAQANVFATRELALEAYRAAKRKKPSTA